MGDAMHHGRGENFFAVTVALMARDKPEQTDSIFLGRLHSPQWA